MTQRLADQVAIVTGGSRGLGLAIAQALAREGASVVIADLNEKSGQEAARGIADGGGRAEFIRTDVAQRDQVERMVEQTLERFGGVNVLVNNAGVHARAPFWEESEELWERMYRVNVLGTALPSQAVVRHMKDSGGGVIVNIASKAGVVGEPGHAAYSASKGAVIAMTRSMAVELAPYAIRVNAVCPGPVMTDMLLEDVPTQEGRDRLAADAPLGRVGQPEDIAEAVLYLASPASDWCTGQAISIDGGLSVLK
jgi:NAD(P)-dependent dehydrogenase (short-subunit alcohol dehydrogenase family)